MGRWGHRVFEGDTDMDLRGDIEGKIEEKLKAKGIKLGDEDMMALMVHMDKPDFRPSPTCITTGDLRGYLDAMSEELFKHSRENPDEFYGTYATIILGACMMKAGASISEDNRTFLREAAEATHSNAGFALPIFDLGFRHAGKAQFLAAVHYYKNGKPRDFFGPSCFRCGRINDDIAPTSLKKCGSCSAWYCNRDCQKANWKAHKSICGPPRSAGAFQLMNV